MRVDVSPSAISSILSKTSGLDKNCRSGVHSFWMPATNRAFPEWAFFRPHNTKTRELRRHAINPNDYIAEKEPHSRLPIDASMRGQCTDPRANRSNYGSCPVNDVRA